MNWEIIVVVIVVLAAMIYASRSLWMSASSGDGSCHEDCSSCHKFDDVHDPGERGSQACPTDKFTSN